MHGALQIADFTFPSDVILHALYGLLTKTLRLERVTAEELSAEEARALLSRFCFESPTPDIESANTFAPPCRTQSMSTLSLLDMLCV